MSTKGPIRPTRVHVSLPARLTKRDERTFSVQVRNVSAAGCLLYIPVGEELLTGEKVILVIDGAERLAGEIRWSADGQAGVLFNSPPPTL